MEIKEEYTIKEIASLLGVSKPKIQKTIRELGIEPPTVSGRFVIAYDEFAKIVENIRPQDAEKFLKKLKKSDGNIEKTAKTDNENFGNSENIANHSDKIENTANKTEQKLIEMLEKALEDKENTIKRQQDTIDNLVKTNTALTARIAMLEDKSKEQIIIDDQPPAEPQEEKKSWIAKLFGW